MQVFTAQCPPRPVGKSGEYRTEVLAELARLLGFDTGDGDLPRSASQFKCALTKRMI